MTKKYPLAQVAILRRLLRYIERLEGDIDPLFQRSKV